jgi:two-component system, sensor histidine kinase PdtaS
MVWRSTPAGNCDYFNKPWLEFTGRSMDQELGEAWAAGVHPDDLDRCLATYRAAFGKREPFTMDYRLRRADGAWRWIRDNGQPYWDEEGAFAGYFGSGIDITDRLETEARLEQAIQARDLLLGELQHRVKNNMQMVVSMLNLQSRRLADPAARQEFANAAWRVQAFALAQRPLFASPGPGRLELKAYLREHVTAVAALFTRPDTAIEVAGDEAVLPADRAVTVALIVNELLINSLRHAFPEGRAGRIVLRVGQGRDSASLTFSDDGIGIPADVTTGPEARSVGMFLISSLASQAEATVAVENQSGGGTRTVITLDLKGVG